MRSEEFPRRRRAEEFKQEERVKASLPSTYEPDKPWNRVFSAAADHTDFWREEVKEKAVVYKCHIKSQAELAEDGTVQPRLSPAAATGVLPKAGAKPAVASQEDSQPPHKRARTDQDGPQALPSLVNGRYEVNRKGQPLCNGSAAGTCKHGSKSKFAHQCPLCLKTHTEAQRWEQNKNNGKGSGGKRRGGRGGTKR